jgi:hypothetical protein
MKNFVRSLLALTPALVALSSAACTAGLSAPSAPAVNQWRLIEFTFTAMGDYHNPATEVTLKATFTGPAGERFEVPGFWDGGQTWKVRFAPTAPGHWTYATTSAPADDAGLQGRAGQLNVGPASGDNPLHRHGGQLKVSANRRFLTYSDGTPFFWLGDTWWFAPSSLVPFEGSTNPQIPSMYKALVDTRKAQGYTVAQMAFLGPMADSSGVNSLAGQGKTRVIDVKYWQGVDRYIDYANSAGIVPVIGLAFHSGMDVLSLTDWQFLWRYVIARYGAHAVTWLIGGEYNADLGDVQNRVPKVLALGQYIKDTDPYKRAMSVHPWWYGGDQHQAWEEPWYDFIMFQGSHQTYPPASVYWKAYERADPKPVLEAECNFEGIKGMTDADVRWCAYRAIQAGSFGYTYGAHGLWYPTQNESDKTFEEWGKPIPWWVALQAPGGAQMRILREVYESAQWWTLEPRPKAIKPSPALPERLRVLVKADGDKLFVVYFPDGLKPDTALRLTGATPDARFTAQWVNLRTGEKSPAGRSAGAAGSVTTNPTGDLALPARPDDQDWVLILSKS